MAILSKDKILEMHRLAVLAMKNAYAPISDFHVGACVMSESGKLYSGCNVESITLTITTHAEMNAIDTMIASGDKRCVAVVNITKDKSLPFPCALCRQKIAEFSDDATVITCSESGNMRRSTISKLYPHSFVKI